MKQRFFCKLQVYAITGKHAAFYHWSTSYQSYFSFVSVNLRNNQIVKMVTETSVLRE